MKTERLNGHSKVSHHIRWIVGRIHVGKSDEAVREEFEQRIAHSAKRGFPVSPAMQKQVIAFALKCHKANRQEYADAMGSFRSRRIARKAVQV